MSNFQHCYRRGEVWYWRRTLRLISTGICDLHLSLRTTDRKSAVILSRKVTSESEIIMTAILHNQITTEEAKSFVRSVIETETQRIAQVKMVNSMDAGPDSFEADVRHDWAHRTAWQLLAEYGVRVQLTQDMESSLLVEGKSERDIEILRFTLDLLQRDVISEARLNQRATLFAKISGRRIKAAVDHLQLRQLLIEAKAVAHGVEHAPAARQMANEIISSMDFSSIGFAPSPQVSLSAPPAADPPTMRPLRKTTVSPGTELDTRIVAVIERMIETKQADDVGLEEKTAQQYRAFGRLLVRVTGKSDIQALTQADASRFRTILSKLPKSFGKSPRDKTDTIENIVQRAEALPHEKIGMSTATVNRYIEHFAALVNASIDEGIDCDPKLNPIKLRRKENRRARDKKRTITFDELVRLFQHPFWGQTPYTKGQMRTFERRKNSGLFWVPLLCAYSGARREEIAKLLVKEVKEIDGVWCLDLEWSEVRRLKTQASRRIVPLHPDLIAIGFLDYVSAAQRKRQMMLFPDLKEERSSIYGRKPGRHMKSLVNEIWGEAGEGLSLNSMRHYVQNFLDLHPTIPDKVSRDLIGHEGTDTHSSVYGEHSPVTDLKRAVDMLPTIVPAGLLK